MGGGRNTPHRFLRAVGPLPNGAIVDVLVSSDHPRPICRWTVDGAWCSPERALCDATGSKRRAHCVDLDSRNALYKNVILLLLHIETRDLKIKGLVFWTGF